MINLTMGIRYCYSAVWLASIKCFAFYLSDMVFNVRKWDFKNRDQLFNIIVKTTTRYVNADCISKYTALQRILKFYQQKITVYL